MLGQMSNVKVQNIPLIGVCLEGRLKQRVLLLYCPVFIHGFLNILELDTQEDSIGSSPKPPGVTPPEHLWNAGHKVKKKSLTVKAFD